MLEARQAMLNTSRPSATPPIRSMNICAAGARSGSIPTLSIELSSRLPSTHCRKNGNRVGEPGGQNRRQAPIKRAAELRLQFIPQPAIRAFDEGVLHDCVRRDVVPFDAAAIRPVRMALLVSSLPLSLTIIFGLPRATWATSFRRIGAPSDESAFRDE